MYTVAVCEKYDTGYRLFSLLHHLSASVQVKTFSGHHHHHNCFTWPLPAEIGRTLLVLVLVLVRFIIKFEIAVNNPV